MRIALSITLSVIILGVIMLHSGVLSALLLFIMVGAIPATTYSLSPLLMFGLIVAVTWVSFVIVSHNLYRSGRLKV